MNPIILSVNYLQTGLHGKETVTISSFLKSSKTNFKVFILVSKEKSIWCVFSSTYKNAILNGRSKSKKGKF